jgi:hypothetical protein
MSADATTRLTQAMTAPTTGKFTNPAYRLALCHSLALAPADLRRLSLSIWSMIFTKTKRAAFGSRS